jgi:hypothetical protein
MSRTRKVKTIVETEKGDAGEEQSKKACSSFSLTLRELFTKNSYWEIKQLILHTDVMFQGDCVKMCEDFAPNFGDNRTGCCITTPHTSFFTRKFLTKNNMALVPTHPTFLFPQLKIKLKGSHFDTTEVIEAESQGPRCN